MQNYPESLTDIKCDYLLNEPKKSIQECWVVASKVTGDI